MAPLLVAGKEAVTIQEVGPGHVDALEGVVTPLPDGLACAAAGLDHSVALATGGEHRAAEEANIWRALAVQEAVDDTEEEVLCA